MLLKEEYAIVVDFQKASAWCRIEWNNVEMHTKEKLSMLWLFTFNYMQLKTDMWQLCVCVSWNLIIISSCWYMLCSHFFVCVPLSILTRKRKCWIKLFHIVPACACKKCHLRIIFFKTFSSVLYVCNLFGRCRLDFFSSTSVWVCAENFFVLFNYFLDLFKVYVTKVSFLSFPISW